MTRASLAPHQVGQDRHKLTGYGATRRELIGPLLTETSTAWAIIYNQNHGISY